MAREQGNAAVVQELRTTAEASLARMGTALQTGVDEQKEQLADVGMLLVTYLQQRDADLATLQVWAPFPASYISIEPTYLSYYALLKALVL